MNLRQKVKLHYKTIIFPIIEYPIFRDTVVYDKFSCYKEGEIERTKVVLKNLSPTYHTVEDYMEKPVKTQMKETKSNNCEDVI